MSAIANWMTNYVAEAVERWNRFWFKPEAPYTLSLIRILAGAMLFYTHLVYSLDMQAMLGRSSLVSPSASQLLSTAADDGRMYAWSYLWYIESPALLWAAHIAALAVFALLTVGLWTRVVSVLAFLISLAYCHRMMGAQFGLDQVNTMLAMYLMVGPSGAVYSVDRLLARRRGATEEPAASPWTTVAIRLIQLHMCIIYLFGGIGKMRGEMWWDGSAVWYAIANLEYQSMDVTWLVRWPVLIALLTHITVFWETFYCFFVWPRLTRPICLGLAVAVHGGIALFLGMKTFGLAMIIGNMAFLYPETVQWAVSGLLRWVPHVTVAPVSEPSDIKPKRRNVTAESRGHAVA